MVSTIFIKEKKNIPGVQVAVATRAPFSPYQSIEREGGSGHVLTRPESLVFLLDARYRRREARDASNASRAPVVLGIRYL